MSLYGSSRQPSQAVESLIDETVHLLGLIGKTVGYLDGDAERRGVAIGWSRPYPGGNVELVVNCVSDDGIRSRVRTYVPIKLVDVGGVA